MDPSAISAQANAAIEDLTSQLDSLRQQQTALLDSLTLTASTLTSLPAYTAVAPTLAQIPAYEAKLARLKATMATQAAQMANLRKRAEGARVQRGRNLEKIRERRVKEREEDRMVLRARVVGEERGGTPESVGEGNGRVGTPPPAMVVRTVKKKKKVRQAQMD